MKELNTPYLKIIDTSGKRVYDILDQSSAENTINKLNDFLPTLRSYGRLNFIAATEAIKKQNWKDAYNWTITFEGVALPQNQNQTQNINPSKGFVSHNEASLMAQVQAMQMQMQMQKQIDEIKNLLGAKTQEQPFEKYLPMLGMFVDITDEKIANMMKLAQIQSIGKGFSNNQTGIAGPQEQTVKKVELTEDEKKKVDHFNAEIDKLSEKTSLDKLTALVEALNQNPAYIDLALNFMNSNKK